MQICISLKTGWRQAAVLQRFFETNRVETDYAWFAVQGGKRPHMLGLRPRSKSLNRRPGSSTKTLNDTARGVVG